MENSSESKGFEPTGLAGAVLNAGGHLIENLIMNPENATTEVPSTHLKSAAAGRGAGFHGEQDINHDLPCFKDLIAVLVECFTIISLGYLSRRSKLISTDAKDLSAYLTTFALPMVIFLNIAQMEFQTINKTFLFCMLISKLLLFIIVSLITLAISYPANFSFAGALSILATQSNDFALGYPLIKSLYGESRPEMLSYLNLMGPIQLLIINPLGIVMLEYGKSKSKKQQRQPARRRPSSGSIGRSRKECLHCSSCSSSNPPSPTRAQQLEPQTIKTDQQQQQQARKFISNQSSSLSGSQAARRLRASKLTPSSQRQRISSSLINLSDSKEQNGAAGQEQSAITDVDKKYIRPFSANSQRTQDDNQLETGVCPRRKAAAASGAANGMNHKNIKSLTLFMPATSFPAHQMSNDSINSAASDLSEAGDASPPATERHISVSDGMKPLRAQQVPSASVRSHSNSPSAAATAARPVNANESNLRVVYTRPKVFNISAGLRWLMCIGNASSNPDNQRQQATSSSDDNNTQMRNVLTADDEPVDHCTCCCDSDAPEAEGSKIDLSFIGALLTNPLIIASVFALAVNLIHGPELPKFVTKVSNTIAASFAAPALFVVGLSMYGNFNLMVRNPNDFLLSSVLVLTKVLVLPSIMRTVIMLIVPHYSSAQEVPYLADFSYLYGLLPAAPGACIIAKQYEVLTNVVSICMLLSTLISAPLVLATSAVISQASSIKPMEVVSMIAQTLRASSSITLVLSLLTLYLLWKRNRSITFLTFMSPIDRIIETANRSKPTHLFTFLLAMTQLVISIGGIIWLFVDIDGLKIASGYEKYPTTVAPEWNEDGELLATDESRALHRRIMELGPHDFLVAQDGSTAHERDELPNFGAMCTMQYVFSSGGLLMARFIILCIVFTNFAKRLGSHCFGKLVCSLIMKVYPFIGIAIILNLMFEASHLTCLPSEPSLPTWPTSIYTRLLFNGTLLLCAIPLFTATFRLENKAAWLKTQESSVNDLKNQRRFNQSSSSLTSDTSSAITTSTNLDTSISRQAPSSRRNSITLRPTIEHQQNLVPALNESASSVLECKSLEQSHFANGHCREQDLKSNKQQSKLWPYERHDQNFNESEEHESSDLSSSPHERREHTQTAVDISSNLYRVNNPSTSNNWRQQLKSSATHIDNPHYPISPLDYSLHDPASLKSPSNNQSLDLNRATKSQPIAAHKTVTYENQSQLEPSQTILMDEQQQARWSPEPSSASCCGCAGEFDKYSILIVFMLFQAFLNLTSMVQQLSQTSSNGTFILVQIANVALDFGQGLVTFLVI